jgi:hypothetical protein
MEQHVSQREEHFCFAEFTDLQHHACRYMTNLTALYRFRTARELQLLAKCNVVGRTYTSFLGQVQY